MNIVEGWIDTALEIDYDNKSMSRQGYKPTHICLHGTAGGTSAEAIAHYFHDSSVDASAHVIIGTDGHVVQGISMDIAAWGNGIILNPSIPWDPNINPNYYTVSIEHCKASTDNSDELTPAQKLASFQVINAICDYYNIPKRRGDVHGGLVGHCDFDSVNRARCPGPYPWDDLIAFLTGGDTTMNTSDPFFQNYFLDKGNGVYQCKINNLTMIGAIAQYWLFCSGAARLPLSGELYSLFPQPDVVAQVFESSIIIYDPGLKHDHPDSRHSCYLLKASDPLCKSLMQQYGGMAKDAPSSPQVGDAITVLQAQASTLTQLQTGLGVALASNQHALSSLGGK